MRRRQDRLRLLTREGIMRSTIVTVFALLTVGLVGSGLMAGGPAQSREATSIAAQAQTGQPVVHRVYEGPDVRGFSTADLSPDGRYILTRRGGALAVLDLITGELRGVTFTEGDTLAPSSGWSETAHFSPEGTSIAYAWFSYSCDCYEIRLVDTDGSNHRLLMRGGPYQQPAKGTAEGGESGWWPHIHGWSLDGEYLLVTFWSSPTNTEISLVSVANGTRRVIRTTDGLGPTVATLSPDGRLLAYDMAKERPGTESDVFVVPVNGGTPLLVVSGPSQDTPLGWAWRRSCCAWPSRAATARSSRPSCTWRARPTAG